MIDNYPTIYEGSYRKWWSFLIRFLPSVIKKNSDGTFTRYKIFGRRYWVYDDPYPNTKRRK